MRDILRKIYDNVLVYEKDTIQLNTVIDREINNIIQEQAGKLGNEEIELYKEGLSSIALKAEQTGFELGVRFMLKLICSVSG